MHLPSKMTFKKVRYDFNKKIHFGYLFHQEDSMEMENNANHLNDKKYIYFDELQTEWKYFEIYIYCIMFFILFPFGYPKEDHFQYFYVYFYYCLITYHDMADMY